MEKDSTQWLYKIHSIKAQIDQSRKSSKKLEEIVFSKKTDSNSSENESEKFKLELFRAEKEIERLKNLEVELKDARAEIDRFRSSFEIVIKSNAPGKDIKLKLKFHQSGVTEMSRRHRKFYILLGIVRLYFYKITY